ncbi:MAG: guanylate kinase [Candidatus Theseobacter exili]|nr:guanylate kinase [Candidatus Theseobacter exili]
MKSPGMLLVLSSPSGGGKTTIRKRIVRMFENAIYSVSCTTRQKRTDELDGRDYIFLDKETFDEMRDNNEFLEYAEVFGNYYGTPRSFVEESIKNGNIVVLDIDVKGAMQIKSQIKGVFIFLVPPSLKILRDRLVTRKTDDTEIIERRLSEAKRELNYIDEYDYAVINGTLRDTIEKVRSIVVSETCKTRNLGDKLIKYKSGEI